MGFRVGDVVIFDVVVGVIFDGVLLVGQSLAVGCSTSVSGI